MDLSVFLAQFLGVLYLVVGLGIMMNKSHYRTVFSQIVQSGPVMYLSGVIALAFGFSILTIHNVWTEDWRMIITVIGWISFLKGVVILVFPKVFVKHVAFWMKYMDATGVIALVLGLVFGYFGFFVG